MNTSGFREKKRLPQPLDIVSPPVAGQDGRQAAFGGEGEATVED